MATPLATDRRMRCTPSGSTGRLTGRRRDAPGVGITRPVRRVQLPHTDRDPRVSGGSDPDIRSHQGPSYLTSFGNRFTAEHDASTIPGAVERYIRPASLDTSYQHDPSAALVATVST
jgi:hypothetical protein